jgi:SWI/SNF-related matrix-associated actin-dependent regulator 1 of chromatin subfamily A
VRLVTKDTVEEQIYALGVSKLELDKMIQGEDGEQATGKGKKKGETLSSVEEVGMKAVEEMMMKQLEGGAETKEHGGKGDVKDLFKDGLIKAGVNCSSRPL